MKSNKGFNARKIASIFKDGTGKDGSVVKGRYHAHVVSQHIVLCADAMIGMKRGECAVVMLSGHDVENVVVSCADCAINFLRRHGVTTCNYIGGCKRKFGNFIICYGKRRKFAYVSVEIISSFGE